MSPEEARRCTLVHISDLHIHQFSWRPWHYANKRLLGEANWWLRRGRQFPRSRQRTLVTQLQALDWDYLLCSGDVTQLSLKPEFELASLLLAPLLEKGQVFVLPGNHDRYVKSDNHFEKYFGKYAPKSHNLLWRRLSSHWWLLAWDSAKPAPWFKASGLVPSETLAESSRQLATLPKQGRVILANHYPLFFHPPHYYKKRRDLENHQEVCDWVLKHSPPIALYLHGHIHSNWQYQPPEAKGKLMVVNSASSTQKPKTGQKSAFHRLILDGAQYQVEDLLLT